MWGGFERHHLQRLRDCLPALSPFVSEGGLRSWNCEVAFAQHSRSPTIAALTGPSSRSGTRPLKAMSTAPAASPLQVQALLGPGPLMSWAAKVVSDLAPQIGMVVRMMDSWQDSIILAVNWVFEQHFGWSCAQLAMSATPMILMTDATVSGVSRFRSPRCQINLCFLLTATPLPIRRTCSL